MNESEMDRYFSQKSRQQNKSRERENSIGSIPDDKRSYFVNHLDKRLREDQLSKGLEESHNERGPLR